MSRIGELEAAVMSRLWDADRPLAVRDVLDDLATERPLAYTTVMTVMDRLWKKGLLTREEQGRAYLYAPVRSRAEHTAALMAEVLADSPDRTATLVRFAESVSAREARQLIAALDARGRRKG